MFGLQRFAPEDPSQQPPPRLRLVVDQRQILRDIDRLLVQLDMDLAALRAGHFQSSDEIGQLGR